MSMDFATYFVCDENCSTCSREERICRTIEFEALCEALGCEQGGLSGTQAITRRQTVGYTDYTATEKVDPANLPLLNSEAGKAL